LDNEIDALMEVSTQSRSSGTHLAKAALIEVEGKRLRPSWQRP